LPNNKSCLCPLRGLCPLLRDTRCEIIPPQTVGSHRDRIRGTPMRYADVAPVYRIYVVCCGEFRVQSLHLQPNRAKDRYFLDTC
jgi:hypothetical protein